MTDRRLEAMALLAQTVKYLALQAQKSWAVEQVNKAIKLIEEEQFWNQLDDNFVNRNGYGD